jgi:EAL domain-containing protein (putative c-di-GMP-specific phosphodiesterase class I)
MSIEGEGAVLAGVEGQGWYPRAGDEHDAIEEALAAVLAGRGLRSVYQPIVHLESGETVAYEALARGPVGSPLELPGGLFAAARGAGRLGEVDWACRAAGLAGALEANLECPVFVNVEPEALGTPRPSRHDALFERARRDLTVVIEFTERDLTARPSDLLDALDRVRDRGWRVAIDDVGADASSLALMPLMRPDVIKLDLRLVQWQPGRDLAEIIAAVSAQAERTGALVLAEGIETEEHLATARALGATLGQGWWFARPGPLPEARVPGAIGFPPGQVPTSGASPFEVVRGAVPTRVADKRLLLSLSTNLERHARGLGMGGLVLSTFQAQQRFTPPTGLRYERLAADAALIAAFGVGMDGEPAPGVRGSGIEDGDGLSGEWSVVVLGPHFAAALVAYDLGDDGPDLERRFEFAVTHDRELVIDAAATLMRRVAPASEAFAVAAPA